MSIKQHQGSSLQTGNSYFNDYTTTNSYVEVSFGFPASKVTLANDSDTDPVQASWDGATLHYELKGAEYKDIAAGGRTSIYIKATTGGEKCRVSAE